MLTSTHSTHTHIHTHHSYRATTAQQIATATCHPSWRSPNLGVPYRWASPAQSHKKVKHTWVYSVLVVFVCVLVRVVCVCVRVCVCVCLCVCMCERKQCTRNCWPPGKWYYLRMGGRWETGVLVVLCMLEGRGSRESQGKVPVQASTFALWLSPWANPPNHLTQLSTQFKAPYTSSECKPPDTWCYI